MAKTLNDLQIIILVTLLTLIFVFIPAMNETPFRIVLGLFMVLFAVGYSLIAVLFPRKDDIDLVERFVLSIGLSIAVTPLIGLALNFSPFGIRLIPVIVSVSSLTIALSILAWFRRTSVEEENRFSVNVIRNNIFEHAKDCFAKLNEERIGIKFIAVVSFIFIISALWLIKNSPATGYEISIYKAIPLVWIFLIGSVIGGLGIIVHQAFTERKSNYWLIGFLILIFTNFVILSMHALRGYLFYASNDHMGHLYEAGYTISTGHFWTGDLHPIIVIYISEISEICGICPEEIGRYLPAFLSVFFMMVCMYLFAREVLPNKKQVLIAAAACFPLFFNCLQVQVYSHAFAVFLFPLILYLYFKIMNRDSWEFRLLFIILLLLLPYSHPSAEVTLIFLFVIMELARIIYEKTVYGPEKSVKIMLNPVLISFTTFFMWISSSFIFGVAVSSIWASLFEPYEAHVVKDTLEVMSRLEWIDIIEYNLKMFGDSLAYIILGAIAGGIIIRKVMKRKQNVKYLFILFVFFLMSIAIEYILAVGVGIVQMGRVLNLLYLLTVAPVLVGFVLYELFKNKKKALAITAVVIILASIFTVGVFSVYHSPWTFSPSWHITNMDMKGSEWFHEHSNSTLEFDAMGVDPSLMWGTVGLIPAHFDYSYHGTLGESLAKDSYAVINERCKLANVDPMMLKTRLAIRSGWGFDEDDFDKLENDPSVAKLYSNGEFDTFLVYSSNMQGVRER